MQAMHAALLGILVVAAALPARAHMELPGAPAAAAGDRSGLAPDALVLTGSASQLPLEPSRTVAFETDQGTWMSLDVSPDGGAIVFDLLGDIFAMPADGGRAHALLTGMAYETQPVFSPDGASIVFLSDRTGNENVWTARADGSGPRQITFLDDNTEFASPEWSVDGQSILVSTIRPEIAAFELWTIDLSAGRAERLTRAKSDPFTPHDRRLSVVGARPAPDGNGFFAAERYGTSGHHERIPSWRVSRRAMGGGGSETVVEAPGSAMRPAPSPDGRWLAYGTRALGKGHLRLRDLATGADRPLADDTQIDQQEAWATGDLIPRFDFTPDSKSVLFTKGGKIFRADVESGAVTPVPFMADVSLDLGPETKREIAQDIGPVRARLAQDPSVSPDGRAVVFSALRRLYRLDTQQGAAAPLTDGTIGASHPVWSADGEKILYAGWEPSGGAVRVLTVETGEDTALTTTGAFYTHPVFTPDGSAVMALRSSQYDRLHKPMEYGPFREADVVRIDLAGGQERVLVRGTFGGPVQFARGGRFYLYGPGGLQSFAMDGSDARAELTVTGPSYSFLEGRSPADDVRISPDGTHAIAKVVSQLYLVRLPARRPFALDVGDAGAPVVKLTDIGADYIGWTADGSSIYSALGSRIERITFSPKLLSGSKAARSAFDAVVEMPRDEPGGTVLLRGATAITMRGDEAISNADILIVRNRIEAIGRRGSFAVPKDASVRNLKGRFVVPGFIDTHAHWADIRRDVLEPQPFGYLANLAYGVTAGLDPSTLTIDQLAYQDMIEAGMTKGPRTFSTGPAVFSWNEIDSLDKARTILRRYKEFYRLDNLKQYRVGNRRQRQWVAMAARELNLHPTTEGAANFKLDMTQVLDGFAGVEHTLPPLLIAGDVVALMVGAQTGYSLTLLNTNGGAPGTSYFFTRHDYMRDAKLRHFTPLHILRMKMDRVPYYADHEYHLAEAAAGAGAIQRAGGVVGVGSHSELEGLGFHWEMAALAMGGLSPHEVVRAATIGSARTIGRAGFLGSLEPGKLADLVVLSKDPRKDIANALAIVEVMKNGRIYDARSLDEVWPEPTPQGPLWFQAEGL